MSAVRSGFRWRSLAAIVTIGMVFAACGDDTETSSAEDETTTTAPTSSPGSGADDNSEEAYAPQPLEEEAKVAIALAAKLEYAAPVFLAEEFGEFEKENLDVEIVLTQDSITGMSAGQIDAAWSAPSAGLVNAIHSGIDMRWVSGNYVSPPGAKSGLWVRKAVVGDPPDIDKLAGTKTANSQTGGVVTYFIDELLQGSSTVIGDLQFQKLAPADTLAALENGALDGAWLIDPLYKQVENNPDMVFVGGQPEGEVGGGMIFAERLLQPENEEVGIAVMRAIRRTIEKHLQPGYKDDPEMVALLAELGGIPEEQVTASDELLFELSIADGLADRMQKTWSTLGLLESGEPLPGDQVVDMRFVDAVESS